jgi:hypothetical protein
VAWHNSDSTTHHIVSDDGSFDTGDIAPGLTSAAKVPSGGGAVQYHCTIHPTMLGTIIGYWDYGRESRRTPRASEIDNLAERIARPLIVDALPRASPKN